MSTMTNIMIFAEEKMDNDRDHARLYCDVINYLETVAMNGTVSAVVSDAINTSMRPILHHMDNKQLSSNRDGRNSRISRMMVERRFREEMSKYMHYMRCNKEIERLTEDMETSLEIMDGVMDVFYRWLYNRKQ